MTLWDLERAFAFLVLRKSPKDLKQCTFLFSALEYLFFGLKKPHVSSVIMVESVKNAMNVWSLESSVVIW